MVRAYRVAVALLHPATATFVLAYTVQCISQYMSNTEGVRAIQGLYQYREAQECENDQQSHVSKDDVSRKSSPT